MCLRHSGADFGIGEHRAVVHGGANHPRTNRVDPDVFTAVFQRGRLGQADDGMFAAAVGRHFGRADQPGYGRSVDDGAAALLHHLRQLVLHAQPDALDVDIHDAVKHRFRTVGQAHVLFFNACVVESAVEAAKSIYRRGHHRLNIKGFADIRLDKNCGAARRLNHRYGFLAC